MEYSLGKCPLCGKNVYRGKTSFFCEGYREEPKCKFKIYFFQHNIGVSPNMARKLLRGEVLRSVMAVDMEMNIAYKDIYIGEDGFLRVEEMEKGG